MTSFKLDFYLFVLQFSSRSLWLVWLFVVDILLAQPLASEFHSFTRNLWFFWFSVVDIHTNSHSPLQFNFPLPDILLCLSVSNLHPQFCFSLFLLLFLLSAKSPFRRLPGVLPGSAAACIHQILQEPANTYSRNLNSRQLYKLLVNSSPDVL